MKIWKLLLISVIIIMFICFSLKISWIFLLIGIIIFMLIYFSSEIWGKINSPRRTTTTPPQTRGLGGTQTPQPVAQTRNRPEFWSVVTKVLGLFLLTIVAIIALSIVVWAIGLVSTLVRENKEAKAARPIWVRESYRVIHITDRYDSIYYFHKGKGLSFENSTTAYCVKNKKNLEVCGEKGQDISDQLPGSTDNTELRFKSKNKDQKPDSVIVYIWRLNRR